VYGAERWRDAAQEDRSSADSRTIRPPEKSIETIRQRVERIKLVRGRRLAYLWDIEKALAGVNARPNPP